MSDSRIEILNVRERRRRWSVEDKLRIVAESREPGASVTAVAARHDVYPNLLSTWRNLGRRGVLGPASPTRFVPVRLIATAPAAATPPPAVRPAADRIEIALPDGSRVLVGNDVDLAALRRVVAALRG